MNVITINRNNLQPITERYGPLTPLVQVFFWAFVYFRIFASAGDAGNAGGDVDDLEDGARRTRMERSHAEDMRGHK